jgi:Zn-dependent protease
LRIRITPGALLLLGVLLFSAHTLCLATLIAVLVHEGGHILAARCLRVRLRLLELDTPGARLVPAGALPSYRAEALLAAAGPAASLLLALFCLPHGGAFCRAVLWATLSLALFNLLPVRGFDGERVLCCALSVCFAPATVRAVCSTLAYLTLLLLFALSACLLLRFGEQLSLAVLSASLFAKLFLQEGGG